MAAKLQKNGKIIGNGNKFFTFHFSLFTFFRTFAPQIGLVAQLVRATDS
jgi:hypothetical protein